MTEVEQRLAIAEACGWNHVENLNTMAVNGIWYGYPPKNPIINKKIELPQYLYDLNAMREAENTLNLIEQGDYWHELREVVTGFNSDQFDPTNEYSCFDIANATALQRATAFLRVIEKRKE
jgi:hypothetical protein